MKAFLILEDGHVFTGTSIGSAREVISEIVFKYFHDRLSGSNDRPVLRRTGGMHDLSINRKLWESVMMTRNPPDRGSTHLSYVNYPVFQAISEALTPFSIS